MPVPPTPMTLRCAGCGWARTVAPPSDALLAGRDLVSSCPRCGGGSFSMSRASPGAAWVARWRARWRR